MQSKGTWYGGNWVMLEGTSISWSRHQEGKEGPGSIVRRITRKKNGQGETFPGANFITVRIYFISNYCSLFDNSYYGVILLEIKSNERWNGNEQTSMS